MPNVSTQAQTFTDPLEEQTYDQVVVPLTDASTIGGLGAPEPSADVTGNHIFRQGTQPVNADDGDLWFNTAEGDQLYKLVNTVWTYVSTPGKIGSGQWINNLVFTATDYESIEWSSGTIIDQLGNTYAITGASLTPIGGPVYIFLDTDVSTTLLQTTGTIADAVGVNRILVCVTNVNSDTSKLALFQVYGGLGNGVFITADNIAANTITGNEIAANTITAGELSVSQLSAITADLGSITAGQITGALFQTSATPNIGIEFDSSSLRAYNGASQITFSVDASTGDVVLNSLASGSHLDGQYLASGSVTSPKLITGLQSWTTDIQFSSSSDTVVAWGGGDLYTADGSDYMLSSGNTGTMTQRVYIYLDVYASGSILQVSTDPTAAVGDGCICIATAINNAGGALFQVFGGVGGFNVDGSTIVAASIAAGTLDVLYLSDITADMGSLTAGTITGALIRTAASGLRFEMTDSTFIGYNSSGDAIFEIVLTGGTAGNVIMGDPTTGQYAQWDNTAQTFSVNGSTIANEDVYGDGADGSVTFDGTTSVAGFSLSGGVYTQTRDVYFENVVVNTSQFVNTANHNSYVNGTITVNGTIGPYGLAGANGGNGGNGVAGNSSSAAGGTAGDATASAGAIGSQSGNNTPQAGQSSSNSAAGGATANTFNTSNGVLGGKGGLGGSSFGGGSGTVGSLGAVGTSSSGIIQPHLFIQAFNLTAVGSTNSVGGTGGASGDSVGSSTGSSGAAGGGGGGGAAGKPGGFSKFYWRNVIISGTGVIAAYGGKGGNGGNAGTSAYIYGSGGSIAIGASGSGGGGGGGGGNGGGFGLIYSSLSNSGTFNVAGGAAGAGGTHGVGVSKDGTTAKVGVDGSNGAAGTAGTAGWFYLLQI